MPTTYAHYRFGNEVTRLLPTAIQDEILQNQSLFQIGLHGPDILFYYKALSHNSVSSLGNQMHNKPGRAFFEPLRDMITASDLHSGASSYLYGFVTHFILDTYCHPYVGKVESTTGLSHSEIEADFDRLLQLEDGFNPISHKVTSHLKINVQTAETISNFYPEYITPEHIVSALNSMKKILDFLVAPQKIKRLLINQTLRITGNYDGMHGLIINYEPNPLLVEPCNQLRQLYLDALPICVQAIQDYQAFLMHQLPLTDVFNRTFENEESKT